MSVYAMFDIDSNFVHLKNINSLCTFVTLNFTVIFSISDLLRKYGVPDDGSLACYVVKMIYYYFVKMVLSKVVKNKFYANWHERSRVIHVTKDNLLINPIRP